MNITLRLLMRLGLMMLLTALTVSTSLAQQDQARLEGVVRDSNRAAVPNASVTIRHQGLNLERTTTTSEDGIYAFQQLRPGTYTLTVTQAGFKTTNVPELALGVGQVRTLDVVIEAGDVTAAVTITAESATTIDTSSNRLGVNVTAAEVEELPVNGRNYSQLYLTAPGAVNTGTGNLTTFASTAARISRTNRSSTVLRTLQSSMLRRVT